MNSTIICDFCGADFLLEPGQVQTMTEGDLEIQFFSCPKCHRKFLALATYTEMRELIAKRQAVLQKLKLAKTAKLRGVTVRALSRELETIIDAQKRKFRALERKGRAILRKKKEEPK